ncbi:hypothetical protein ACO0LL_26755 [Undibacterium sp. TC4M20W]|uniref:hypothetical protein n=1 Tax=Undibacterium sp. TC4M20W TaxID=3413052 RepID=UPI003BF33CD4
MQAPACQIEEMNVPALMFEDICRNLPGNTNWPGSFYEQLAEHGIWNTKEFWLLHRDLVLAANKLRDVGSVDKQFALTIVRLQATVDRLFSAHFDENDVFKILAIDNELGTVLNSDELHAFKERFDLAVTGVFSGEIFPEYAFELVNPLL